MLPNGSKSTPRGAQDRLESGPLPICACRVRQSAFRAPNVPGPVAVRDHRRMEPRRNRPRARTAGAGAPAGCGSRGRAGRGHRPGAPGPRARAGPGRDRRIHAAVRPGQRGRRAADVRGRGAAAHPRPGHHRPPDPRQAGRGRLEAPHGPVRVAAGQRLHLGPDADRAAGGPGRRHQARRARRLQARDRPRGRAGDPAGGAPGDADHGPPVRDGAHDWRRPGAQPQGRQRQVPLFIRHARRGGDDRAGRGPLPGGLPQGDRRDRRHRPVQGRDFRAVDLGQAVGPAPAL